MSIDIARKYCKNCGMDVKATRERPHHLFHLFMSIITGGLWLIVWILAALLKDSWHCSACGSRIGGLFYFLKQDRKEWDI